MKKLIKELINWKNDLPYKNQLKQIKIRLNDLIKNFNNDKTFFIPFKEYLSHPTSPILAVFLASELNSSTILEIFSGELISIISSIFATFLAIWLVYIILLILEWFTVDHDFKTFTKKRSEGAYIFCNRFRTIREYPYLYTILVFIVGLVFFNSIAEFHYGYLTGRGFYGVLIFSFIIFVQSVVLIPHFVYNFSIDRGNYKTWSLFVSLLSFLVSLIIYYFILYWILSNTIYLLLKPIFAFIAEPFFYY